MSGSSGNNNSTTNEIVKVFAKLKFSGVAAAAKAMNNEKSEANQTITAPHPNESCAKNENKSPSPMSKIFTNAPSFVVGTEQPSQTYASNEDDLISICENIERIAIESALDQTTNPNPTTKTTLINRNNDNNNNINRIVDETTNSNSHSNRPSHCADDKRTTSTSGDQFYLNLNESNALNMKNKLRHIDSGELPWWMTADDDTTADDITLNQTESETRAPVETNNGIDNGKRSWLFPSDDQNRTRESSKPMFRVTKICSGERAWWMDNDANDEGNQNGTYTVNNNNNREPSVEPENSAQFTFKIKRIESGEKAWWMTNDETETETNENIDFWSEINEKNETERNYRIQEQQKREQERNFYSGSVNDSNEGPLGHRASPEGLEDFTSHRSGLSPYAGAGKNSTNKLFISRHQNIDDLLGGGTSHPMNLILMDQGDMSAPLEEILPTQVRIHDGTAHTSYMQYMGDER